MELTKLVSKTTRYSGEHAFFSEKFQNLKKIVKIVAIRGNSGNSVGDGVLNSNQRGTGRGKTAGDLGERVPQVPHGIPNHKQLILTIQNIKQPQYLLRQR